MRDALGRSSCWQALRNFVKWGREWRFNIALSIGVLKTILLGLERQTGAMELLRHDRCAFKWKQNKLCSQNAESIVLNNISAI